MDMSPDRTLPTRILRTQYGGAIAGSKIELLPPTVEEQRFHAKLSDGVLTITLNKREDTQPRKITVA